MLHFFIIKGKNNRSRRTTHLEKNLFGRTWRRWGDV